LVAAVSASQLPAFVQHYMQRLGGHLAEAERNVQGWQEIASEASGGDVMGLVHSYLLSANSEVIAAGRKCAADLARVDTLRDALGALQDAPAWVRPFTFFRHADGEIARATLADFSLNVPLDLEGLIYAACGLVLGLLFYRGAKQVCLLPSRRRARKRSADVSTSVE